MDERYASMSPEEFAELRQVVADTLELDKIGIGLHSLWAKRLSRALDVIERVTGERDRCSKAAVEHQDYQKGYQDGLNAAHADEAERMRLAADAARPLSKGAGYTAIANARLLLAQQYGTVESLLLYARRAVSEGSLPGMRVEVAAAILRLHEEARRKQEDTARPGVFHGRCPKCTAPIRVIQPVASPHVVCPGCGYEWDEVSLLSKREAPVETPEPEKRCGTCEHGQEYTCVCIRISTKVTMRSGSDDGGYLTRDDGPPWENCRFWKPRV